MIVHDLDLCIELGRSNPRGDLMTFAELKRLSKEHDVAVWLEKKYGPNGWPTFGFEGSEPNVRELLNELGYDEIL